MATNARLGKGQSCETRGVMNEIRVSCIFILLTNVQHKVVWLLVTSVVNVMYLY